MNLYSLSREINKPEHFFTVMKCTNRDRFDFVMSFSENQLESCHKFVDYVIDLFYRVSIIEMNINIAIKREILKNLGNVAKGKEKRFETLVHQYIDFDRAFAIQFSEIMKVKKFEELYKEWCSK